MEEAISWALQNADIKEIRTPEKVYLPEDNVLLLQIEFGMSNQYIIDLRKNVKRGMQSKREKGWLPTKAPIGYRNEVEGIKGEKRILPNDDFKKVQKLWNHLLKINSSLADLYRYMEKEVPLFRDGRIIALSTFCNIFRNPFYTGVFLWKGEVFQGKHKPMITPLQFEKAQQIITVQKEVRNTNIEFDLKGIFKCGHCGAILTAEQHKKTIKRTGLESVFRYYRCSHKK